LYGPPQTGKTTLAEALALSSSVPLVRLSSFDLTQEPQETIESRGRVIFDALSMLTNAVILFDEFESVLQERAERHERSLEFLLTGLLPKLVKLHTLARSQALVYFLATNRIERIDQAAIRRGRFDVQLPVYNPDALSRTAACLYRLQIFRSRAKAWPTSDTTKWTNDAWQLDAHDVIRLLTVVDATRGIPPVDLAQTIFRLPKEKPSDPLDASWRRFAPYFTYILEEKYEGVDVTSQPVDVKANTGAVTTKWAGEEAWLNKFEQSFQRRLRKQMQRLAGQGDDARAPEASPVAILKACLLLPPVTH
jgi:hypothetical protein